MGIVDIKRMQIVLWRKYLPWLQRNSAEKGTPHDYFSVFFKDAENNRYRFKAVQNNNNNGDSTVVLTPLYPGEDSSKPLTDLADMETEIVHYKRNYSLRYKNIFTFTLDHLLKVITLKTTLARIKGGLVSGLKSDKETISRDRFNLLRLLVAEYVHQRPSRSASGFHQDDIIALLHGTLWYKHIKNESFRRKIKLLLESLVVTGDLTERQDVYYVQGQAITTLVEHEKEERRDRQQQKIQKNSVRFMLVITVATLLIILVLLSMAGIVDLAAIWHKILQIKPVRFMLKFI